MKTDFEFSQGIFPALSEILFGRYDEGEMKTPPAINFPEGGTPAERLDMAFRKVLTVPKAAILKEEAREKAEREKKRAAKKPH